MKFLSKWDENLLKLPAGTGLKEFAYYHSGFVHKMVAKRETELRQNLCINPPLLLSNNNNIIVVQSTPVISKSKGLVLFVRYNRISLLF